MTFSLLVRLFLIDDDLEIFGKKNPKEDSPKYEIMLGSCNNRKKQKIYGLRCLVLSLATINFETTYNSIFSLHITAIFSMLLRTFTLTKKETKTIETTFPSRFCSLLPKQRKHKKMLQYSHLRDLLNIYKV